MKSLIFLVLAVVLTYVEAHARGPAVEDFVGIESEQQDVTPEGTEALFNFEKDVKDYQNRPAETTQAVIVKKPVAGQNPAQNTSWPLSAWFGVAIVLALPLITWVLTMGHLKKRAAARTTQELPSNVTPLPTRTRTEEKDDIKKAS